MKRTNKIISIILAIFMVMSIIPITVSATTYSGICGDKLTWIYDTSSYTLTISGTGDMYDYKYNNRPWESYKYNIKQIIVSNGVTSIGTYAFYYCIESTSVAIPDSVTTIRKYAFANCYKLENVTIPDSVTTIGEQAFYACETLTSVVIPASVTTIEKNAFYLCDNLISITVDSNSQYFANDEYGVLFNKDKTTLIKYPSSSYETRYTIPDGVTEICQYAFDDCINLKSVTIPVSVTTLGKFPFHYQYYTLILYYNGTESQWNSLIADNNRTDYLSKYTVHCLDKTLYPSGVCGNNLIWMYDNSTGTLTISGSGEMYNYEFDENSGFGFRPWEDFIYAIKHVIIEDGVTSIGTCAFMDCQNLTDIKLSGSVTSIGDEAFSFCPKLTDVYYTGTENQWNEISIDSYNQPLLDATIHYNYHIHEYDSVVTDPTCTEQGYTTYTCECGDSYNDNYVDSLGHEYKSVITPPNCTEQGFTTYTCYCGDSYVDDYVDATEHAFGDWIETKEATVDAEGEMERVCSCGEKEYKVIEKLPAVDNEDEDVENPDIPNTSSNSAESVYVVFILITFICATASLLIVCRRRCK